MGERVSRASKLKYPDRYRRVRRVPGRQPGRNPRPIEREERERGQEVEHVRFRVPV